MKKKLTYVDLFCGAGGMSLGFDQAGFSNIFSLDIEPSFCATYRENFPSHKLIQHNISTFSAQDIINEIKNVEVDVVIGGPPCQGFSMAGMPGRKFIDDDRNQLFKEFARFVKVINPRYFVMENVQRLYTHNNGETRKEIIDVFKELGYYVECKVIKTAELGVPQNRSRVLFIGNRISESILFPNKTVNEYRTVRDAINDFPKLSAGERSEIPNHVAMKHSAQMLEKMSYISDGGNRNEIPQNIRPSSGDVRKYIRYKSNAPSVCVTGDMRKIFHYSQNRALTVRELAAIQTFPNDFIFKGNTISQQQQVGNSVPPLLAKELAMIIKQMYFNDTKIS